MELRIDTFSSIAQFGNQVEDREWLKYFDVEAAVRAVAAHVAALPSSSTAEQHTRRVYSAGLTYFLNWSGERLPTEDLMVEYIGHLKAHKGLKSSTIASKYLAPVRLFLQKLAGQRVMGFRGDVRDYIGDCRLHLQAAATVKNPRDEESSNIAPLWREGVRLEVAQVNAIFRKIDRETLSGLRDYALLMVAFESALRLAELARITLKDIRREGNDWLITVRGKRNNCDPVTVSDGAIIAMDEWVTAYNHGLAEDDGRRIGQDTPIWQGLIHGNHYGQVGKNGFKPMRGMSHNAIADVIKKRAGIAPHDTRRTCAAIAYDLGMALPDIQGLMRHKSPAVTLHYIGQKPEYGRRKLGNFVTFG